MNVIEQYVIDACSLADLHKGVAQHYQQQLKDLQILKARFPLEMIPDGIKTWNNIKGNTESRHVYALADHAEEYQKCIKYKSFMEEIRRLQEKE